ncbi:MAG: hypothetical protein NDJ89_01225 [Oligoflexia bacterium]|nr:hypothetical protein [Oligoflexia bacterium]
MISALAVLATLAAASAGERFSTRYSASLTAFLGLDTLRIEQAARDVWLAHPSLLKQWELISAEANATYNGALNTIEVSPALTLPAGSLESGKRRLKTVPELLADSPAYAVHVTTVFHELAHAEYDVLVEEGATAADRRLFSLIEREIRPSFASRFPRVSSEVAVSEYFAYFHGAVLELLFEERHQLLFYNGIDPLTGACLPLRSLREKARELPLREFLELNGLGAGDETPYAERIQVDYVFVQGRDLALSIGEPGHFRPEWKAEFWRHFEAFYQPPRNRLALLQALREDAALSAQVARCRATLLVER